MVGEVEARHLVQQTVAGFVRFAHYDDHGSRARAATATLNGIRNTREAENELGTGSRDYVDAAY